MARRLETDCSRHRTPAVVAGILLGAAPVTGLVAIGVIGDWTLVGGDETVSADAAGAVDGVDGFVGENGMDGFDGGAGGVADELLAGDPASISVPLPEPASVADAPLPPELDVPAAREIDSESLPAASDDAWHAASPANRSLVPAIVPPDVRDEIDVLPASVRIADADDVTISFRTETGLTGHAVGTGSIEDSVVPLYFSSDRDRTIRVIASSVRGETVIATIRLAQVVGRGGLDVTGPDLGSIEVRALSGAEMASRLGIEVADLDDYREHHLTL